MNKRKDRIKGFVMVDATLRCNEVFRSPGHNMASANGASYQDLLPSFCQAYRDCALLGDRNYPPSARY